MQNANTKESLDTKLHHIFNQLENLEAVPGIQIETGSILKVFFPVSFMMLRLLRIQPLIQRRKRTILISVLSL